jgi:hypothetical protein
MRLLRIGTTDFESYREFGDYYADKTEFLYRLVRRPDPYFLSRPRRFGKSLLVSTLESILRGQRELFKGLWIDGSDYDWTPYPVITLDMNGVAGDNLTAMNLKLSNKLNNLATDEDIELKEADPSIMFENLIVLLFRKFKKKMPFS